MVASFNQIQSAVSNSPVKSIQDLLGSPSPSSGLPSFMNTILPQVSAQSLMSNALANIAAQHQAPTFDPSGFITTQQYLQQHPIINTPSSVVDTMGTAKDSSSDTSDWTKLFTVLNDTFGQVGGVTRTTADNIVSKLAKDWNSNDPWYTKGYKLLDDLNPTVQLADALGSGITSGAKQQWKDWTDLFSGKPSWGAVPGFGLLDGMANSWTSGEKLNQDLGINNLIGNLGGGDISKAVAGLGTEILTDPLTYLTGGLGMATKAGKAAELSKIAELGNSLGIEGKFKTANDFINAVGSKFGGEATVAKDAAQLAAAKATAKSMGISPDFISHPNDLLTQIAAKYPTIAKDTLASIENNITNTGKMFEKAADAKVQNVTETIDAARAVAANKNMNTFGLSFPFSNVHVPLGKTPETLLGLMKNPLYRSEVKVNDIAVNHLKDTIKEVAGSKSTQLENAIKAYAKKNFGTDRLEELTQTQYNFIMNKISSFDKTLVRSVPDANVAERMLEKTAPNEVFDIKTRQAKPVENVQYAKTSVDDILKGMDTRTAKVVAPLLRGLGDVEDIRKSAPEAIGMFSDFAKKLMKTAKGKTLDDVKAAFEHAVNVVKNATHTGVITREPDIVYKELERTVELLKNGNKNFKDLVENKNFYKEIAKFVDSPYTEVNNAKTAFDSFFDKSWNKFNPRSLATKDDFVNSMANHVADANSAKIGLTAQFHKAFNDMEKYVKKHGINDEDWKNLRYHMEGQAPKSYGKDWVASTKVQGLAKIVKPMFDELGKMETNAGTLSKLRENYFPHVLNSNLSEDDLKAIMEAQQRTPQLRGVNAENKFDNERKSFQTFAEHQDHLDSLAEKMKAETDPEKLAKLQSDYEKASNLFEPKVDKAIVDRIRSGVRSITSKELQDNLRESGMLKTNPTAGTHLGGLERVSPEDARKLGLGKGQHYIQPDVLEGMKRVDDIFTAQGMKKLVRHVDAITNLFRLGVTTFKFSHYRNNFIGNAINNLAAGVSLGDYKAAFKLLKGLRSGTLDEGQMKIIASAYKHNVINGGFINDIIHEGGIHFSDPTKLEKFVKAISDFKPAKKMRSWAERQDDVFRLGNYINGLKKFGKADKAANQVRTYLFNYNEMTNADRAIRRLIPFWNWTRRNLPLQVKNLFEKPAIALNVERIRKQINEGQDGADWQKDTGIKIPGMNYYTSIPTPTDDLKQFLHPTQFAASMNPILKMAIEGLTNKKLYTNKPISYGSDSVQAKDVPYYMASNFGVTKDVADAFGMGGKKTLPEIIANYFNPISVINKGAATHQ